MKIPNSLELAIEEQLKNKSIAELKEKAQKLSDRYMKEQRKGQSLLSESKDALVYSIMRMPATFCAVTTALKNTLDLTSNCKIETVLDIGSGTGAGTWAVSNLLDTQKITCIEREQAMQNLGKALMKHNQEIKEIEWISTDILKDEIVQDADLIIISYVINELKEEEREKVINKILNIKSKIVLVLEPGTPEGFKNIKKVQKIALEQGKHILAPCTCQSECKLPKEDWCHSTVRVERTKIHKLLKSGDAPYEDEKFSYIAISSEMFDTANARILRHPIIEAGKIILKLCTKGEIETKVITKKEKEKFKQAKKKKCGDAF